MLGFYLQAFSNHICFPYSTVYIIPGLYTELQIELKEVHEHTKSNKPEIIIYAILYILELPIFTLDTETKRRKYMKEE
ncbi:hypothetical protein RchiOBHm_Chr1g0321541 [Rosa chinensis]|uniref:Uncharacterized protein n=1 Tax=Rosa chinensis TaxID=74649 RepID=A0A2P6S8Z0_ROSCH|nr:hypothetical protein RchiOBHm_Chr1g0321541 [Rosa chinensis]